MKKQDRNWTDSVAEKIARTSNKVQTGFANGMSRLTGNVSAGRLKIMLFIFCVGVGGYCVYIFGDALFSSKVTSTIHIQKLVVPKHATQAGDENLLSNQYVDEPTYQQIIAFKRYMDSLKVAKHPLYDSLSRARPGLLDSVQILIEAYEQFK
ncbi:MAG: hypothetical protein ABI675_03015 [Chitinophagaceae bacterium]